MDNPTNAVPRQGVSQTAEVSGNTGQLGGRQGVHPEGLYRHPNGAELITQNDPLLGDAQGRAAERLGFEYVGPAPKGSIKTLGAPSEVHAVAPERQVEAQSNELADLRARLAALEGAQDFRTEQGVPGGERTKQAAVANVEQRTGQSIETSTEENLEDLSYRELQARAKDLGLDATGTKEELTQRIAEKESK